MTDKIYGSSNTNTPFFAKTKLIDLNTSSKFGICEIVFAENIKSTLPCFLKFFCQI